MKKALVTALGIGTALVISSLWWRKESRLREAPFPSWLAWWLENPLADVIAGTQITLDRIGIQPGERVLDVGSGPGRLSLPAARLVGPDGVVVAIDLQPEMLERLHLRAVQAGLNNIETRVMDVGGNNNLEPDHYDRAWLVTVLGEITERELALNNLYQAIKPGGTLSITEILLDPHHQKRSSVLDMAQSAGFKPIRYWQGFFLYTQNFVKPGAP